ncbi:hypothetical protein L2E82_17121 [Cichorium intybus]|uniref:Uncharacterized protein n=1 Tax=Cichorium intybus TaxID=13427 RepID=A0ACB9F7E4_CICIN|nr:hypothetical protein L2E82_17121 [Cichorium intybus]
MDCMKSGAFLSPARAKHGFKSRGSFSRSAVNHESGAKNGLSGIVMGIIMACALFFMTPFFVSVHVVF